MTTIMYWQELDQALGSAAGLLVVLAALAAATSTLQPIMGPIIFISH